MFQTQDPPMSAECQDYKCEPQYLILTFILMISYENLKHLSANSFLIFLFDSFLRDLNFQSFSTLTRHSPSVSKYLNVKVFRI